jgi:exodeoxyribonuclease-3
MLIATWNVNGIRARAERLREWLDERKPDVVCLQELKAKEGELERETFESLGYKARIVGQPGWNGVAVLAREQPETLVRELPGAGESGARFLSVRVSGIEVASVYVPNGKTKSDPEFQTKLAWLERLAIHVEARRDRHAPLVVAGDFNVCLTDLDSYLGERGRGAIFHSDEERSLLARLAKAGMVDLFRAQHPDDPGYSWWDYRGGAFHKKLGMRLDLLWATDAVAKRVKDVVVDREFRKKSKTSGAVPSDHAPVVATLD